MPGAYNELFVRFDKYKNVHQGWDSVIDYYCGMLKALIFYIFYLKLIFVKYFSMHLKYISSCENLNNIKYDAQEIQPWQFYAVVIEI